MEENKEVTEIYWIRSKLLTSYSPSFIDFSCIDLASHIWFLTRII